ncbi:MAG: tape measure protein [Bacilli bacterium]
MAQQIASMFASLGFKVDKSGLEEFSNNLRQVRTDTVKWARSSGILTKKITGLKDSIKGLNTALNQTSMARANQSLASTYQQLSVHVNRVNKNLRGLVHIRKDVTNAMGKINGATISSVPNWERYAKAIRDARIELERLRNTRGLPNPPSGGGGNGGGRGNGNGNGGGRGNGFGRDRESPSELGRGFFRSMLPAVALGGGGYAAIAATAGYVVKETVEAGREVNKMRIVLQMASKDSKDLEHNFKFVRDTAQEMGVDVVEFGNAYAKMLSATRDNTVLSSKDKEMMFSNLSKYMVTIGSSTDDQKGIFRALTQMFTKGKLQAEEMLQMAERGVPAAIEIKNAAIKGLGMTNEQFNKAQQKGLLDPSKLLPIMAEQLAKLATESGAYDKAINSSAAAQQRFYNTLKLTADAIYQGGLDQGLTILFNALTKFVQVVGDNIKGIIAFIKVLKIIKGYWDKFSDAVGKALGLVDKYSDSTEKATEKTSKFSDQIERLKTFFSYLIFPIKIVTKALGFFKDTIDDMDAGKWTWLDTLGIKVEIWSNNIQARLGLVQLAWKNTKKMFLNPIESTKRLFGGEYQIENFGANNVTPKSAFDQKSLIQRDVQNKIKQSSQKELDKIKQMSTPKVPLMPTPNLGLKGEMPTLEKMFGVNVYIDGNQMNPSYITTSLMG